MSAPPCPKGHNPWLWRIRHQPETTNYLRMAAGHEWRHPKATIAEPSVPGQPRYLDPGKIYRLPPKWRPAYDELSRRMYADESTLDFACDHKANVFVTRPWDHEGPRDEGWTEYDDPQVLARELGLDTPTKRTVTRKPTVDAELYQAALEMIADQAQQLKAWADWYRANSREEAVA